MKLDILGLQSFVAIVEHGSFQNAADHLKISQTGLSKRLQGFEKLLGTDLIERTTRKWGLSDAGRRLLPKAQRLVHELERTLGEARDNVDTPRQEISIACVSSIAFHFLPKTLLKFERLFPDTRVNILDGRAHEVSDAVRTGRADFGIALLPTYESAFKTQSLLRDPFIIVTRDDHALSQKRQILWTDLGKEPLILFRRTSESGLILEKTLRRKIPHLNCKYEVQHPTTALGLVLAGAGIAILPSLGAIRGVHSRICVIPLTAPSVRRHIGLIQLHRKSLSLPASRLREMLLRDIAEDATVASF